MQKFLQSHKGFLRAALIGHGHSSPFCQTWRLQFQGSKCLPTREQTGMSEGVKIWGEASNIVEGIIFPLGLLRSLICQKMEERAPPCPSPGSDTPWQMVSVLRACEILRWSLTLKFECWRRTAPLTSRVVNYSVIFRLVTEMQLMNLNYFLEIISKVSTYVNQIKSYI